MYHFKHHVVPHVEELQARLAPATLVNAMTVTYQDVDGDTVTVKISKPLFNAATINAVLDFDIGSVNNSNALKQQLRMVNLTPLAAAGTALAINAIRSPINGGD